MLIEAGATTKLQCRLTCTQVMSELNRWMKATAPICRAASFALVTCAAPGLRDCRLCSMTRRKMRSTMPSTAPSRCMSVRAFVLYCGPASRRLSRLLPDAADCADWSRSTPPESPQPIADGRTSIRCTTKRTRPLHSSHRCIRRAAAKCYRRVNLSPRMHRCRFISRSRRLFDRIFRCLGFSIFRPASAWRDDIATAK